MPERVYCCCVFVCVCVCVCVWSCLYISVYVRSVIPVYTDVGFELTSIS